MGGHATCHQRWLGGVADGGPRVGDDLGELCVGRPASGHAIVDDKAIIRRVHDDFAGRASEGLDLARRAAPKLKLLAQGTVPRLMTSTTASLVEPKSSDTVTAPVVRPRSTEPISSRAAIGCGFRTATAPRSMTSTTAAVTVPKSSA